MCPNDNISNLFYNLCLQHTSKKLHVLLLDSVSHFGVLHQWGWKDPTRVFAARLFLMNSSEPNLSVSCVTIHEKISVGAMYNSRSTLLAAGFFWCRPIVLRYVQNWYTNAECYQRHCNLFEPVLLWSAPAIVAYRHVVGWESTDRKTTVNRSSVLIKHDCIYMTCAFHRRSAICNHYSTQMSKTAQQNNNSFNFGRAFCRYLGPYCIQSYKELIGKIGYQGIN